MCVNPGINVNQVLRLAMFQLVLRQCPPTQVGLMHRIAKLSRHKKMKRYEYHKYQQLGKQYTVTVPAR